MSQLMGLHFAVVVRYLWHATGQVMLDIAAVTLTATLLHATQALQRRVRPCVVSHCSTTQASLGFATRAAWLESQSGAGQHQDPL